MKPGRWSYPPDFSAQWVGPCDHGIGTVSVSPRERMPAASRFAIFTIPESPRPPFR